MNKTAVRTYNRLLNCSPRMIAQREGWECDRHFDGGEWSDGFHSRFEQEIEDLLLNIVADRFHVQPEALYHDYQVYTHEGHGRWMDSMFGATQRKQLASEDATRFIDGDE